MLQLFLFCLCICFVDSTNSTLGEFVSLDVTGIENDLHEKLLKGYNPQTIPRNITKGPAKIMFHFSILSLVSFDVKTQVLDIFGTISMEWEDYYLRWDIFDDYLLLSNISVATEKIWTPDVVLFNSALEDSKSHLDLYKTRPLIYQTGLVYWRIPIRWKVSCTSDVTWFPMDKQICKIYFGSWTYDKYMLQLLTASNYYNDTEKYFSNEIFKVNSGEWKLKSVKEELTETEFDPYLNPYSTMVYSIELKRMPLFYFLYIIAPLLGLSFLFLFVFHLPHDSGERSGFGVTVLLSITVYLMVISEKVPEKSDTVPFLGICFVCYFFLLCIALLLSIFTMYSANFKTKPPGFLVQFSGFIYKEAKASGKTVESAISTNENVDGNTLNNSAIAIEKQNDEYFTSSDDVGINMDKRKRNKKIWKKQWKKISRKIEIFLFFTFTIILVLVTILIWLLI